MSILVLYIFIAIWITSIDVAKLIVIASGNPEKIPFWHFFIIAASYTGTICHIFDLF